MSKTKKQQYFNQLAQVKVNYEKEVNNILLQARMNLKKSYKDSLKRLNEIESKDIKSGNLRP